MNPGDLICYGFGLAWLGIGLGVCGAVVYFGCDRAIELIRKWRNLP